MNLLNKRFVSLLLAMVMIFGMMPLTAFATEETTGCAVVYDEALSNFEYTVDDDAQTVTLTKYIGSDAAVVVADSYTVDGVAYATVLDSSSVFRYNSGITSVSIGAGVVFKNNSMAYLFSECKKLVSVDMTGVDTSEVTDMRYLFDWCSKLTTITGYENWDTGKVENIYKAFNRNNSITTVDLSNWDLSNVVNSGWCFQQCYATEILLPDNLKTISAGFLNHASKITGSSFTIPAGVEKIGYAHTIYDFATSDFVEFIVAEGNEHYVAIDGILYSADGTEMLAVPRNKTFDNNTYEIPEGVTFLGELSFSRNYNIHTLVLPDSFVIEYVPLYDDAYIVYEDLGNLNAGTNLSIAIYCYTGITEYAVKDTNPNYASLNGIIYSKDMTEVVAIPARYAQEIVIPEGVTAWNMEAMWADTDNNSSSTLIGLLANCPGVSIPASLESISEDQLSMLNLLYTSRKDTDNPFTITIAEGNTAFELDESEGLVAKVHEHSYENGICTGCGNITTGAIWQIIENGEVIGAFSALSDAVDACRTGGTICLTADCSVTSGVVLSKALTIDGGGYLVDISGCSEALITVNEGVSVTLRNLRLDGGATGFAVDYDGVTYTNYTIPLVSGSLANDPKASQSAIISSGTLICENVDISNRYTASVGGAMQILAGSASLTDCDFTHNYGTSKGGALFIGSNLGSRTAYPVEQVTISGCTFSENYTGHGGAIYAYNVSVIDIAESEFISNTANGGKGGAIDLFSETTRPTNAMALGLDFIQTTIRNCSFRGNWAGNDGFAIQSYDSDLYIYDSEFIENVGVHPTSSVGTVSIEAYRHADENYRIYTLMDGCLFDGNRGPCAVYGDHSSVSDLDVTGCVFKNNVGNMSFLLYAATSHISDCQFIGETAALGVIDARIYENYTVAPELTLTDATFTDCDAPTELLLRKHNHNTALNTYRVILEGATNGDITVWDSNCVTINGIHTGNVQFGYGSEREDLTIGTNGKVNGIIFVQPVDGEAKIGDRYCVTVEAEGEGLTYQWYFRNAGAAKWHKSSVKDNTYDDVMTSARVGREVYCVITDQSGNSVTTDVVTLVLLPAETLEIVTQPTDGEAILGERYCVTVEARGDGLKYQWYFRNAGATRWSKSGITDNTYDDILTKARIGREIYCLITDQYGNSVTTDIVKLVRVPMALEIVSQPTDSTAVLGEMFCVTVEANGEGLKYQWYYRNSGSEKWNKSSVHDNTYDDTMTKARANREVYCVITDIWGNSVTTDIVKLIPVAAVELELLDVTYDPAALGERYCVTVNAQGEGLTYTWYFRKAGATRWSKSGVTDNTYDDVMNKTRANREVYCVITDAYGNKVTTEVITLTVEN